IQLSVSGANAYNWSPGTGLSCTTCPDPIASPPTTTTYTVEGTDLNGCTDTGRVTITVDARPQVLVFDRDVCVGDTVILRASGAVSYNWSPATGLSCTNCDAPVASPAATTTYTVVGTFAGGCADTTTVTVTVNPLPTIAVGADTAICLGESVSLKATGGVDYSWTPAAGLSCINCDDPIATPSNTTTYVVGGKDAKGCINYDTVEVRIKPLPAVD